jgi:hypothetical protein
MEKCKFFMSQQRLKLNARKKTLGAGEKLEDFETHFRKKWCFKTQRFNEAPHIVGQLYKGAS